MRKSSLYILIVALLVTTLIFLFGRGKPNREIAREYIPVDKQSKLRTCAFPLRPG